MASSDEEPYSVYTTRSADKDLRKLNVQDRERIEQAIHDLGDEPYPHGAVPVQGTQSGYRIRRGDYRAVYEVDEAAREITVTKVAHRREVYR